ncbi:MAG: glycosyltransferase family 1 protein [Leptolyngbyaceae cyanobacterium SL_1_1]|nr:glycosyltransferase family 1 protein [Leptolyngbyaceae cyanobacterium RM1_1_2]NJO10689.1 glycosyltransferase family 1 protein [Leptolyngbyaceae cyanobacterium SL_1_1]
MQKLLKDSDAKPVEILLDEIYQHFSQVTSHTAPINWALQTFLYLKRKGLDVHLTSNYVPNQICIVPYDFLSTRGFISNAYVVACQYDRGRPQICHQRIVQNKLNVIDKTDHFIPHWPQPNLIPRDPSRGFALKNLGYKGREYNLASPFKQPDFLKQLEAMEIALSFSNSNSDLRGAWQDWNSYQEIDVILAVRNSPPYHLDFKPASKLVNAWMAGCPALLGPEPAYQQLRQSELDYIEVQNPDDIISALQRLKQDSSLYEAMVKNGLHRAKEFTPDKICDRWQDVLAGPITQGYEQWRQEPAPKKAFNKSAGLVWQVLRHRQIRNDFWQNVRNNPKPFAE